MYRRPVSKILVAFVFIFVTFLVLPDNAPNIQRIQIEHEKLPPVYQFDDVSDCLYSASATTKAYCVAKILIDPVGDQFQLIQDSKSIYHFNREVVTNGVCIEKCQSQVESSDNNSLQFDDAARFKYEGVVQQCINSELLFSYNMTAQTAIEYCVTDEAEPYDLLDLVFVLTLATIISTAVLATAYSGKNPVIKSFSVTTNWTKFTEGPRSNDLVFLDCIKVVMMLVTISGHFYYLVVSNPHKNSIFFEMDRYSTMARLGVGYNFMNDVFFIISGFLLSVSDAKKFKNGKNFTVKDLLIGFRNRYFRLAPLLAFVILLQSTMAEKVSTGPIWMYMAGREKACCRKNYWTNLLFINNFVNLDTTCLLPTWYISADLHLYLLKYVFLILLSHLRKHLLHVFVTSIGIFTIITTSVAYIFRIKGIHLLSLEAFRTFTRDDLQFNAFVKPTYTNLCCYFMGVATAFLYREVKSRNFALTNCKPFVFSWVTIKILLPILIVTGYVIGYATFEQREFFAVFAGLYKLMWGFVIGAVILGYQNGFGGVGRTVMNATVWKRLAKLNYCVLLLQVFVFQLFMGEVATAGPVRVSYSFLAVMIALLVILTYAIAVIFYILVELPASNLFNCWRGSEVVVKIDGTIDIKVQK